MNIYSLYAEIKTCQVVEQTFIMNFENKRKTSCRPSQNNDRHNPLSQEQ